MKSSAALCFGIQEQQQEEPGIARSHYYTLSGAEIRQNFTSHPQLSWHSSQSLHPSIPLHPPHPWHPACHNNRAEWSVESWELNAAEGGQQLFQALAALFRGTPHLAREPPFGIHFRFIHLFVASCFSFILNFRRFNSAFELLFLSSVSVSVFPILCLADAFGQATTKRSKGKQFYITERMQLRYTCRRPEPAAKSASNSQQIKVQ